MENQNSRLCRKGAKKLKRRRVRGKVWWAKRRRKIVRRDNGKVVEFEEV